MSVIFLSVGMPSIVILSVFMLSVIYAKLCNKVHCPLCIYFKCRYAECRSTLRKSSFGRYPRVYV